jgi:hypothetical protein
MATSSRPRRTQVEALDDLRAEIRLQNILTVLSMGVTALEHDDGKRATSPEAIRRKDERNVLRAEARDLLGMSGEGTKR